MLVIRTRIARKKDPTNPARRLVNVFVLVYNEWALSLSEDAARRDVAAIDSAGD